MVEKIKKWLFDKKRVIRIAAVSVLAATLTFSFAQCTETNDDSSSSSSSEIPAVTYVVSFETNGGSTLEAATIEEGTTIDLGDYVPTKDNCYFYGWCLDETLQTRAATLMEIYADVKLYAEWGAEEKYSLSFETGNGSKIDSVLYRANDYLNAPADPTRENYAFAGWYTDAACTKEFSFFGAQMPKKALTVYAKWTPLNGILFETNGGSAVEAVYGATGDSIGSIAAPTKENYVFGGWYADANCTTPYDVVMIPSGTVTVYAKWYEQLKDVNVTLHLNFANETKTVQVTGNGAEALDASAAITEFTANVNELVAESYLGESADLAENPIYNFSAWAYDAAGSQRFNGILPNESSVELYAVWSRSAAYCEITFVGEDSETSYFVNKNTEVNPDVLNLHVNEVKNKYEALGCTVEGFYTLGGNRYLAGEKIAMDMRLLPYVYSSHLVYEYVDLGSDVTGYALKGYDPAYAAEYKAKDELLLLIPEYYKDKPVVWVSDRAFLGYNVNSVTMPESIRGIGKEAFKNTKLTTIDLSSKLYFLGDNAFSGCASLATVNFNSELSQIGATIFEGTAYETTMPRDTNGFVFFDAQRTIIYSYEGETANVRTPSTARTIGGGAFKGNATIKNLTLSDGIRYVSDYAFANTAIENVTFGKFFADMGVGIFSGSTKLTTVSFASKYNLSALGESMFEGCTSLKNINVTELANLKEVKARAFYGCTSLQSMTFGDNFLQVGESAFENCTSLVFVDFGTSASAKLSTVNDRAFAGCSSLKRVILRGDLINNQIVSFKKAVFENAGYDKNGVFVTPVLYVKDNTVDGWYDDEELHSYTYVEIYKMRLPQEYKNLVVKAIDSREPELIAQSNVEIALDPALAEFDVLAFFKTNALYSVSDNKSEAKDCLVYVAGVVYNNAAMVEAVNGKYNFNRVGTYVVTLRAEDEFGNTTDAMVTVNVVNA